MKPTASMTPASEATTLPTDPQHQLNHIDPPMSCQTPDLTQNAVTVLERRYLKKDPDTGEVIETPAQLFWRVASHVANGLLPRRHACQNGRRLCWSSSLSHHPRSQTPRLHPPQLPPNAVRARSPRCARCLPTSPRAAAARAIAAPAQSRG